MRALLSTFAAIVMIAFAAPAFAEPQHGEIPGQAAAHGAEDVVHEEVHEGDDSGGAGHAPKTYFGIPAWILKLVNLALFVSLLVWLLGGPIRRSFAERRAGIQRELALAEERRAKTDSLAADIQSRLEEIEVQVAAILARAKEEGERQREEMIQAADLEAQKILAQARAEVDARTKAARQQLAEYARELAVQRAASMLEGSITDADRTRLFDEGVAQVSEVRS